MPGTKNTLEDLKFAEMYLDYVSRRGVNHETKARAQLVLATVRMLDVKFPTWRENLIAELASQSITRTIPELFSLRETDSDQMFSQFLKNLTKD